MNKIMGLCKCEFSIIINGHKNSYESVGQYFEYGAWEERNDIDDEVFNEMVSRDTMVRVACYNRTPVGFYSVYHYDVTAALEEMLETLQEDAGSPCGQ